MGEPLDLGHVAWTATEPGSHLVEIGSLVAPPQHPALDGAEWFPARRRPRAPGQPGEMKHPANVLGAATETPGQLGFADALVSQPQQATFERT